MINQTEDVSKSDTTEVKPVSDEVKRKRVTFPRLSLKKAMELPKAVYNIGQGEPVRRLRVFDSMGKAPNSGPSRTLVIASGVYGLTIGGYQADYLELTGLGKTLVSSDSQIRKHEIIYSILFGNEIFSNFIEYWKNKAVPTDDIAEDWLVRNYNLISQDAKAHWEVIKANIFDFNLTEQLSGKNMIIPKDAALESTREREGSSAIEQDSRDIFKQESTESAAFLNIPDSQSNSQEQSAVKQALSKKEFKYGTAQLILPGKMTEDEISKLKTLIDGLVDIVKE